MAKEEKEIKWVVKQRFYDLIQKREVEVGEIVEHNQRREEMKLIEKK